MMLNNILFLQILIKSIILELEGIVMIFRVPYIEFVYEVACALCIRAYVVPAWCTLHKKKKKIFKDRTHGILKLKIQILKLERLTSHVQ